MSGLRDDRHVLKVFTIITLLFISIFTGGSPLITQKTASTVNGLIHPLIDGVVPDQGSDNFANEWDDAPLRDIELKSDKVVLSAKLRIKIVEDTIYVAIKLPAEVSLGEMGFFSLYIDRDNDLVLSMGDIRLVRYQVADDGKMPLTASNHIDRGLIAEVFTGEKWSSPPTELDLSWGRIAFLPNDDQEFPGNIEAAIYLGDIDRWLQETYPVDRLHWIDSLETQQDIGFSFSVDLRDGTSLGYPDTPIKKPIGPAEIYSFSKEVYVAYIPIPRPVTDFSIDHIEITQATQDFSNSFTLVQGKRTAFRIYLGHNTPDMKIPVKISVRIYAPLMFRNGRTIYSTEQEFIAESNLSPFGGIIIPRGNYSRSFNVVIEGGILKSPIVNIEARITSNTYADSDPTNNVYSTSVTLQRTNPLNVYVVNTPYGNSTTYRVMYPDLDLIAVSKRDMAELFPTPLVRYIQDDSPRTYYVPIFGVDFPGEHLNNFLGERYEEYLSLWNSQMARGIRAIPYPHQYHGFVNPAFGGGLSTPRWGVVWSRSAVSWSGWGTTSSLTMAHEINHNLGDDSWGRHVTGFGYGCGAPDGLFSHDGVWEGLYGDNNIHETGWKYNYGPVSPNKFELMTYCNDGTFNPVWINGYRWERLFNRFNELYVDRIISPSGPLTINDITSLTPQGKLTTTQAYPNTVRSFSGFIWRNGTTLVNPSFEKPGRWVPRQPVNETPGIILEVQYKNNTILKLPFGITFLAIETESIPAKGFTFTFPDNGEVTKITMFNATTNQIMTSVGSSSSPIDGNVNYPIKIDNGFKEFNITVEYLNNETTIYARAYYSDGNGWRPISSTSTSSVIPISLAEAPGADQGQIHVLLSNGFDTTVIAGPTTFVEYKLPKVTINSKSFLEALPDPNSPTNFTYQLKELPQTFTTGEMITLQAASTDEYGWEQPLSAYSWDVVNTATQQVVKNIFGDDTVSFILDKSGQYMVRVSVTDSYTNLIATETIDILIEDPVNVISRTDLDEFNKELELSLDRIRSNFSNSSVSSTETTVTDKSSDQTSTSNINPSVPSSSSPLNFQWLWMIPVLSLLIMRNKYRRKQY